MPRSKVQSFSDWEQEFKDEGDRAARQAKASEAPAPAPELTTDPVTGEQREAPAPELDADWTASFSWPLDTSGPDERPLVDQLRAAMDEGTVGHLAVEDGSLVPVINELRAAGYYAREGAQATAGVLIVDRSANELVVIQQMPGCRDSQIRSSGSLGLNLDDPDALAWLTQIVTNVRDTPRTAVLPLLIVVMPDAAPTGDPGGLMELASAAKPACVAMIELDETPGWRSLRRAVFELSTDEDG